MENAWSLSEVCRFRVLEPPAYDNDRPVEEEKEEAEGSGEVNGDAVAAGEDPGETAEAAIAKQALGLVRGYGRKTKSNDLLLKSSW